MLTTHRCMVSVVQTRLLVCQQITTCVEDVAKWMGANRLQLNGRGYKDSVPVVQLSSAYASTTGFASHHWRKFRPSGVGRA